MLPQFFEVTLHNRKYNLKSVIVIFLLAYQWQVRFYVEVIKQKPTEEEIKERVLKVCASYDKVTADKVDEPAFY